MPEPISPLPEVAAAIQPPLAAIGLEPAAHTIAAGAPFVVKLRAFPPLGAPPLVGVLRWRERYAASWQEVDLQDLGDLEFTAQWVPEAAGEYEWAVELWPEPAGVERSGSSGPESVRRLRVTSADPALLSWRRAPRSPLQELHPRLGDAADWILLPVLFPTAADGLVGQGELGHFTIDARLGDTRAFAGLATAAYRAGVGLAMTIPLTCSPEHPWRRRRPVAFSADGTPELAGHAWRELWGDFESVFRFWLVQGIELFHIPDAGRAPLEFWRTLIEKIRDDFPRALFTTEPEILSVFGEQLLRAGFSRSPRELDDDPPYPAGEIPAEDPLPLAPLPPIGCDDNDAGEIRERGRGTEEDAGDERRIACACSNSALRVEFVTRDDDEFLEIDNLEPERAQSGHLHLDGTALGLDEHERFYVRDVANGRAYGWTGTTNFLSLEAGEAQKVLRVERR